MQTTLLSHPALKVIVRTGSEGPRHDPYAYSEVTVETPKGKTVLHQGLGTWLSHDGNRIEISDEPDHDKRERMLRDDVFPIFTGYKLKQLERIARKMKARCRQCGSREFISVRGFPGETFEVCNCCGNVVDSFFCIEAIM